MSNRFHFMKESLHKLLQNELPGHSAHQKMAPMLGKELFRTFTPSATASKSAVLVLLFGSDFDSLRVLLTLRSSTLPLHSNQISFPGGHSEPNEGILETAIRECFEETGIAINESEIIGFLSELFVPPSNTVIWPVVAFVESISTEKTNNDEVAELFSIPIAYLMDEKNIKKEIWTINERQVLVPFWEVHNEVPLWGATAMILAELIEILQPLYKSLD